MFKLDKPIIIDRQFPGIASRYELDVLYLDMDEDAIRIRYKVTPSVHLDPVTRERITGFPLLTWAIEAKDDRGNAYDFCGGACGLSPDETHTEGVVSCWPLLTERISFLDLTMTTSRHISVVDFKCEFRVFLNPNSPAII